MNRTAIEWTQYTWNPVVGCFNECPYCYARRQARRQLHRCIWCHAFKPHLHPERLQDPLRTKKPSLIFVCSMADLFGPWVPAAWISLIIKTIEQCPQHDFQFLTKSGHQLNRVSSPDNCWLGVSIDTQQNIWRRGLLEKAKVPIRFISFEPLLTDMPGLVLNGVDWVIVGAQTGPGATKPQPRWVHGIIDAAADAGVPVFLKDNIGWFETIRQWPIAYERRSLKSRGTR